jgi:hypothetical protein
MRALLVRAAIGAAFVLVTGGCGGDVVGVGGGSSNVGGGQAANEAEYEIALKKWQAGAPPHYQIVYQQTCECSTEMQRPTRVTVRRTAGQDAIEDVADAGTPPGQVSDERRQAAKSVDGLLVLINQGLGLNPQEARITYDGTLGYPLSINIDPTSIPGDEIVYKVTSFATIP